MRLELKQEDLDNAIDILQEAKNLESEIETLFYGDFDKEYIKSRINSATNSLYTIIEICSLLRVILDDLKIKI